MAILMVSDVHLSASRPHAVAAFLALLQTHARAAEALYILGDLFDQWLGDDDETPPHPHIVEGLARVSTSGTDVCVLHGNHDFLLGGKFAARTGCRILPDPTTIDLYGTPTLLMHGDSLCTDDVEYQTFRTYSRNLDNQRAFLHQPFAERIATANALRLRSQRSVPLKPDQILDVNGDAVEAIMREYEVFDLIHGHTHRPAVHRFTLDGRAARRIVLGDWYEGDNMLVCDSGGPRLSAVNDFSQRRGTGRSAPP